MKISRLAIPLTILAAPFFALAQTGINTSYITPYSQGIIGVINNILVPVLMAIAFIVFLWGVYKYFILGAADEKSRADGRQFTLWGIIGFVVILSLWGLVNLLMGTFGLSPGVAAPPPPTFGTGSYSAPGGGGGGGGISATTAAALTQQYQAMQSTCAANPTSSACIQAQTAYGQAYNTAYYGSPTGGGAAGTTNTGCTDPSANNYNPYAESNDGSCTYASGGGSGATNGCTDPAATNYNPVAETNDGSCTYDSGGVTQSEYQACVDANGGDPFGC